MMRLTRRHLVRSGLIVSASSLLPATVGKAQALMRRYAAGDAATDVSAREHLLFDFGWKFFQGHGSDPRRDLGIAGPYST